MDGRLFEAGANSLLGAYLNKYGNKSCSYFHNVHLALLLSFHERARAVLLNDVTSKAVRLVVLAPTILDNPLPSSDFILDLGGGGGDGSFLFHFILSKIVV